MAVWGTNGYYSPYLAYVLMISGMAQNYDRRKAQEAGADGFITEPFSLVELAEKVEVLLGSN